VQFKVDGVNYGAAVTSAPYTTTFDSTTVSNGAHTITAAATDSGGNTVTSAGVSVTVAQATSTTVSVTSPTAGATVSGKSVTLAATATPGTGLSITNVQFKVDGVNYGAAVTSAPYTIAFDSTTVSNGAHTITAAATDSGGNTVTSAGVSVTVAQATPTTVSVTSPTAGATISGTSVALAATATPGTGLSITNVQFKVDGVNYGSAVTSAPYTIAFDSTTVSNGAHTITAAATDSGGNTVTSAGVAVTISNSGPTGTALLTGYHPQASAPRNNFTSQLGFQFTVGSNGATVTALGRIYLTGNTGSHVVKLVNANGTDVAGGSATVSLSAANTDGQFVYASLAAPVHLTAGSSYYLLSQETSGGDSWWDWNTQVTPVSGAPVSVVGPVYQLGSQFVVVPNSSNYSYVPVNLLYQ
jgi:hypothetical protein